MAATLSFPPNKQKEYLNAKFQIGERSGQKAGSTSVSKAMRTAKDANAMRLFDNSDFLTVQQIASFFSRLAAKRSTEADNQVETEDDERNPVQQERQLQQIKENVVATISIQHAHPIVYDAHNICDLVENSKLSSFSIKMQQEICSSFGLDTSSITLRRKKPYIDILTDLVKGCQCHTNE